jgi:MarR family transcriptional regulator, transcriptional regulator for hemolysin
MSDRETRQLEFAVDVLARRMRRVYNQMFLSIGVSYQQASAMIFLDRFGPQAQGELAERMQLSKAAAGALMERMEAAGLILRSSDQEDGRIKTIMLTERARLISDEINRKGAELGVAARAGLSEKDRRKAVDIMLAVEANLSRIEEQGF